MRYLLICLSSYTALKGTPTAFSFVFALTVMYSPELIILAPSLCSLLQQNRKQQQSSIRFAFLNNSSLALLVLYFAILWKFFPMRRSLTSIYSAYSSIIQNEFIDWNDRILQLIIAVIDISSNLLKCFICLFSDTFFATHFEPEIVQSGRYSYVAVSSSRQKTYQPAAGVLWYLDAQMLPDYEVYFEVLVVLLPILAALVVWARLSARHPLIAVNSSTNESIRN